MIFAGYYMEIVRFCNTLYNHYSVVNIVKMD